MERFSMEELLVENLFSGERELQIEAASEVGKLNSKQRHKLVERGIIDPLVALLHSEDYHLIEASLFALLSLACGSERNKIMIAKSGVIPVMLELLQYQSEDLTELVVAAMLILSSCSTNKLVLASSGAIQVLIHVLNEEHADDSDSVSMQAQLDALATLHNLSTCHQIMPSIVSSGAVFTLLQLIHTSEKSSGLVEKAVVLLENIVSSSETALQETASSGEAIRALVEAIEEGSSQCREHAAGVLLLICKSCRDKYKGLILKEGAMPGLLQLSLDGTWNAQNVARELLVLLRDRSTDGSRSKQSKHEVLEHIMHEIDAEGEEVNGETLRLVEQMLANLST